MGEGMTATTAGSGQWRMLLGRMKYHFWVLVLLWTGCVAASLLWNLHVQEDKIVAMARNTAQVTFENDVLYRRWAANQGGVYVGVSEYTPPNPYLQVPERDVTTTSGQSLTLVNPAYMTRQVNQMMMEAHGSRGHITSLKPLRPENSPDPWERAALNSFEKGVKEVASIETVEGNQYMRLMRPFVAEEGCLKCHASQGYKEGDIRGGISVSIPMAPLRAIVRPHVAGMSLAHFALWVFGVAGIAVWKSSVQRQTLAREEAEMALRESEERFKVIASSTPDHLFVQDRDLRYTFVVNPQLGLTEQDMIGKTDYDFLTKDDAENLTRIKRQVVETGSTIPVEIPLISPKGETQFFSGSYVPKYDARGQIDGLIGYFKNITDRKRAEKALSEEQANLQAIFDVVNVGMLLIDRNGVVRRVNNAVFRWIGQSLSERSGDQPGDFMGCIHALDNAAGCGHSAHCRSCPIRNLFESVLRCGQALHDVEAKATVRIEGKEANLWLEVSADPLTMKGQRHVILAINNITARKRAEETLRQTAEELKRSNHDLEQFAYVASHDLQEPLRMISGFLQLLQDRYKGKLDAKADEYIGFAFDGAGRMSTMIRDLLAYSRAGSSERQFASVDLAAVVEYVKGNLRAAIEESQAVITHDALPTVTADPAQMRQVFQNILGNALKFRAQDRPAKIHISARREDGHWVLRVKDNGIGIAPDHFERIFMLFQRLNGRDKYSGSGIGLAICKKIIDRHGGRIGVESQPGQGSTFYFTLKDISS
ncbi:MAG: ATP-binding protein [Phycisphaerae bacterium]|jgi:PAS domain S-box-containing protein